MNGLEPRERLHDGGGRHKAVAKKRISVRMALPDNIKGQVRFA